MTSAAKLQKDKFYGSASRLIPRPTAASAARAARNTCNRNSTAPSSNKSPSRTSSLIKAKNTTQRNAQKIDSKTDIKVINTHSENNVSIVDNSGENREALPEQLEEVEEAENTPVAGVMVEEQVNDPCTVFMEGQEMQPSNETITFGGNKSETEGVLNEISDNKSERGRPSSATTSRPQTPKSLQSTPKRPNTPVSLSQKKAISTSRPNTPQRTSVPNNKTRLADKSQIQSHIPTSMSNQPSTISNTETKDIKSIYTVKKQQFHTMKKDLDFKQQSLLELFDLLRRMEDQMAQDGISGYGEVLNKDQMVIFNVADWALEEVAQLCRNNVVSISPEDAGDIINTIRPIDDNMLLEMEAQITNMPANFANLCLQAFTARQELIDWVKAILEKGDINNGEDEERIDRYNKEGLVLCDLLHDLKNQGDKSLDALRQFLRQVCLERRTLTNVGESLLRELASLRQDEGLRCTTDMQSAAIKIDPDIAKTLEETMQELKEEQTAKSILKEKLATSEAQLRQTRMRVNKMDRQLREAEASIASLTGTVKSLEDQSRQKEVQLEARARKLRESLKTGEVTNNHIIQQRDALQKELEQLQDQIEKMSKENKSTIQDLNHQLKDLKSALEAERNKTKSEIELKNTFEASYSECLRNIEEFKAKIIELENSRPNPDLPTEREMELQAELIAVKDVLRSTEDEVTASKREKVRFLETLTKITESETKVGMQQKLAAELMSKEEIVSKMQSQIRDLTKNIKLNEQKVIQYEQYIQVMQAYSHMPANSKESPDSMTYQDLQQEIMHLRIGLLEEVHRNKEMTELLMQKDETSRAQARVIKVREELINMLKNKETEQSRELSALQQDLENRMKIVDEVNKQIAAKADEIQELFITLDNKQQQIHRLEKIVLALEEQQRRAQAQRTRYEEKIAALEHELSESGTKRKFLFF